MREERQKKLRTAMFFLMMSMAVGVTDTEAADTKDKAGGKAVQAGERVTISGETIGVYLETAGVLVADIGTLNDSSGNHVTPAEHIARAGDYIQKVNDETILTKSQLIDIMRENHGDEVALSVCRDGETIEYKLEPAKTEDGSYKLGLWVRDDLQGIGTMTYVGENGSFGALGHGISDSESGSLLSLSGGTLYKAGILEVKKGQSGSPGELKGSIYYADSEILGTISENTSCGVFGRLSTPVNGITSAVVASRDQLHTGDACIYCNVGDGVQKYDIRIEKIRKNTEEKNKSFVIRVTDADLLEKTGGIVQGMSGAPILQDGKLVGAVTHVFVNDPTKGYGVFIENMLEQ